MNILMLGAFGKGALENYYISGLEKEGVSLTTFDIAAAYYSRVNESVVNKVINKIKPSVFFQPINKALLRFIEGKYFDVILVFKGLALFPDTIRQLKEYTRLLCCYNPDHPFKFYSEGSGNKNVSDSIQLYDIYYTYAEQVTHDLKTVYSVNAYTIPFGYDETVVATNTAQSELLRGKWLFAGAYDRERAAFLEALGNGDVFIYGDDKWKTRNRQSDLIQRSYQQCSLYDDDYKTAVKIASGVFNLLRRQNIEEGSHNMRTFEVPGYGGLLIANRTPEQSAFFEEDKEAIYFGSITELKDKLRWLQSNSEVIEKIKMAALSRSQRSGYGYGARSRTLYNHWKNHL